jgi:cell division protein FtsQ
MSKNRKQTIWRVILGLLLAGVLVTAYILGSGTRKELRCNNIHITIEDSLSTPYLTAESIRGYLAEGYGNLVGRAADSLDFKKIETILNSKAGVLNSDVYITNKGTLVISIEQRKPIIRFKADTYEFYCDKDGHLLPLRENFDREVLIVDGHIPIDTTDCQKGRPADLEAIKWLDQILTISNHINSSDLWKDKIAQISHKETGELIIKPKDGKEIFLFGDFEDIQGKFEKMEIYYERIVAVNEEGAYNVVDLRFNKQIVCKNTERKNKK